MIWISINIMLETDLKNELERGEALLLFKRRGEEYMAQISLGGLVIFQIVEDESEEIASYDRQSNMHRHFASHVCGLQGFNPYLGDNCKSCDYAGILSDCMRYLRNFSF